MHPTVDTYSCTDKMQPQLQRSVAAATPARLSSSVQRSQQHIEAGHACRTTRPARSQQPGRLRPARPAGGRPPPSMAFTAKVARA
jgi:hypothetical protein